MSGAAEDTWREAAEVLSTWTLDLSLATEPVKWGHLAPEAAAMAVESVKNYLLSLPVEQRMEAMGMAPAAWWIPPFDTPYDGPYSGGVIESDEVAIPERLDRRGSGEDGWPNVAWHLLWVEADALSSPSSTDGQEAP